MELDFAQASQKEMQIYQEFRQKYEKQFPTPERAEVRMMNAIGWQFIAVLVQGVFAILLAAMRTSEMFYKAASSSNPFFSFSEAVSAVIAIEGGIVIFAAIRAEMQNRNSTEVSVTIDVKKLYVGEAAALLISVVAGLGVSFGGFGIELEWFKWVMSAFLGIGASLIAAVSGEIIGTVLARFGNIQDKAKTDYTSAMTSWQDALNKAWEGSPERTIARNEIATLKEIVSQTKKMNVNEAVRSANERTSTELKLSSVNSSGYSVNTERTTEPTNELGELSPQARRIFDYLDRTATPSFSPGVKDIVTELGVSKGYASEQARKWKAVRNWPGEFSEIDPESLTPENEPIQ